MGDLKVVVIGTGRMARGIAAACAAAGMSVTVVGRNRSKADAAAEAARALCGAPGSSVKAGETSRALSGTGSSSRSSGECLHLLDEGVADVATIDAAISDGLAPRWLGAGPLATADLGGIDIFNRIAAALFPELAATQAVSPALELRAAHGRTFYDWDSESREAVERLRIESLHAHTEVARARREVMPASSDHRLP